MGINIFKPHSFFLKQLIQYQDKTIVFCADLIPTAGHVPIPYVMGYDIGQINAEEIEDIKRLPEIILVKRIYPDQKGNKRIFKLRRLEKDGVIVEEKEKPKKKELAKEEQDMEDFLNELEYDKNIRKNVNLYRDDENIKKLSAKELKRKEKSQKEERNIKKITGIKSTTEVKTEEKKEDKHDKSKK